VTFGESAKRALDRGERLALADSFSNLVFFHEAHT
jgi:hypothetical protein